MLQRIFPVDAPTPRGPYSPAVRAGDFIYVSGQGPVDAITDKLSYGTIQHETRLALGNIKRILEAAGATPADVVKCNVYLRDGGHFAGMNEAYREFFGDECPARTTVATGFSDPSMKVEIDCIAYKPR
jgi:2-iminobutanoate/2-iminopropanoate deaminase